MTIHTIATLRGPSINYVPAFMGWGGGCQHDFQIVTSSDFDAEKIVTSSDMRGREGEGGGQPPEKSHCHR